MFILGEITPTAIRTHRKLLREQVQLAAPATINRRSAALRRFFNWAKRAGLNESYLLQYHCFAWAKMQGCTHFDFRTIPEVLEPGEEMWGIYEFKKGFGGYSDFVVQTQDYIYRPVLYNGWSLVVKHRRAKRKMQH